MGMFDEVTVDAGFECIKGHSLEGEVMQTKGIGEWPSLGKYWIRGGMFGGDPRGNNVKMPYTGSFWLFGNCTKCEMKTEYGKKYGRITEFVVWVEEGRVAAFERVDDAFDTLMQRSEEGEFGFEDTAEANDRMDQAVEALKQVYTATTIEKLVYGNSPFLSMMKLSDEETK